MTSLPWELAWRKALYGPDGFYRRPEGPAWHFTTAAHQPLFAKAVRRLAIEIDDALGQPDNFTVVDVGAGHGELLRGLAGSAPERWALLAVDVAERPQHLSDRIEWQQEFPHEVVGLVFANELLDVVPCPVVTCHDDGAVRLLLVDPATGDETVGPLAPHEDLDWLGRWWDLEVGERAEVGRSRDQVWVDLVGRVSAGAAVAVDYAHSADERNAGRYAGGTLVGHRHGSAVAPVPDGSCDLTAHVALDSCAAAAAELADATLLTRQREALQALGIRGDLPSTSAAATAPHVYAAELQRATEAGALLDPTGFGGFGWLMQTRGLSIPSP